MGEHSPTPWLHNTESIWAGGQHVARLDGSHDLAEANGDLIVHAVNLRGEMVEALRTAQSALAMLTEPKTIQTTNVREAWGIAVEAEMKCRSALAKASPTPRKVPDPTGSER